MTRLAAPTTSTEHHDAPPEPGPGSQVLLVSELFPPAIGGSAVLFQGIYSRLHDARVTVLTDGDPSVAPSEPEGRLTVMRYPLATRRWGLLDPVAVWQYLRVALRIRLLSPRKGAVVHCARAMPEGVAAMLARALGGAPYVCWAHGEDLTTASASREFTALTRLVLRGAAATVANSRNTAAMLKGFGVPDHKIHVVYPAVDTDRFHPGIDGSRIRSRYATTSGDILLLSVGRLQRRKGHDVAIQAVAALREALPHLRYLIVGDGEERHRLEQLVAELRLEDRVSFAGVASNEELPEYYAACDVFLHPNRVDDGDIEGFGIVFLEAAAMAKPVIGGDSGGVPEAVERDVTGLLVDGASVDAVVAAIADLSMSDHRRRHLGLAGRRRARDEFSWERAAAAISELQARIASR